MLFVKKNDAIACLSYAHKVGLKVFYTGKCSMGVRLEVLNIL